MKDLVLLDTSVASIQFKQHVSGNLRARYRDLIGIRTPALCFQSIAELQVWPLRNDWGSSRKATLNAFIRHFFQTPFEWDLTKTWAEVMAQTIATGTPLEDGDAWVVATAIHYELPLITHDKDQARLHLDSLKIETLLTI